MDVTSALQNLFGGDGSSAPSQAQAPAQASPQPAPPQAAPSSYQAQAPAQSAIAPGAGVSAVAAGAKPSNVLAVLRPGAAAASTPGGGFSPLAGLGAGSASDFAGHSKFGALAAGFMAGMKGAQEQQSALAKQAEEHMKALFDIKNKQDTLAQQTAKMQQDAAHQAAVLAQQKVRDSNLADYYKGQNANGAAKAAGGGNAETLAAHELARFRHFQTLGGAKQFLTPDEAKKVQEGMDAWDKTNPAPKAGSPVGAPAGAAPSGDDASPDPATAPTPSPDGSPAPDPNIDPSTGAVPTPPSRPQGLGQPDPSADGSNGNPNPGGMADGATATNPKTGEKMVYSAKDGSWSPLAAPQGATPSDSSDNANLSGP